MSTRTASAQDIQRNEQVRSAEDDHVHWPQCLGSEPVLTYQFLTADDVRVWAVMLLCRTGGHAEHDTCKVGGTVPPCLQ